MQHIIINYEHDVHKVISANYLNACEPPYKPPIVIPTTAPIVKAALTLSVHPGVRMAA